MDRTEAGTPYFAVLGPVEVTVGGVPVHIGGPRERRALAALLLVTPRSVSVARLTEVLWDGAPPATAKAQVHNTIARLRGSLSARVGQDRLIRSGSGYVIQVRPDELDALTFANADTRSIELANRGQSAAAAQVLLDALRLWRGPALDGLDCPALRGEASQLDERRLVATERRIELDLSLGRQAQLPAELAGLVAEHPLRERLVELRMVALHRTGRRLEALELFNDTRVWLAEQTGLDPRPELERIHKAVLTNDTSLDAPTHPEATQPVEYSPLPELPRRKLPRFIGRERDLAQLDRLLVEHSVVSLTGPPGAGKTRLAVEVITRSAPRFAGGAAFVALDAVRDGAGVADAVLAAMEPVSDPWRSPVENIHRAVGVRDTLLVLDNCEHVAAECARLVSDLVAGNARLRVLVTSQVPLGLPTELRYALGPLSVPADDSVSAVVASEAGSLLIDRASLVDPGFGLTAANAEHAARLCRTVEGLPLALELAAGRLRAFSLGQIADRLHHQLEMLATRHSAPRHASLRAAIDWSYDLLSPRERLVFSRLSVFLDGFTLEAAEAVVGGDDLNEIAVMDTLGVLVERSLVSAERAGEPGGDMRYRMSEALREYAVERRADIGTSIGTGDPDRDPVRARHAAYFSGLAEEAERHRRGPDRHRWLIRVQVEYANIRSAMAWAQEFGDAQFRLRLVCAMTWFWRRYATREGVEWLRMVLPGSSDAPGALRQRALTGAGSLALRVNIEEARGYVSEAIALGHARADRPAEVTALSFMASVEVYRADADAVAAYGDQAVELARKHGDPYLLARTLLARALTQAHVGAHNRSDDDLAEARVLFSDLDDRLGQDEVRLARTEIACAVGDVDRARAAMGEISGDEDGAPSPGSRTYWLCRAWLALATGDGTQVPALLHRALTDVADQSTGPYGAQRVFGPALDLAAGLASIQGEYARAVALRHAATGVLTLGGSVPERPDVRWSTEVDHRAAAALDPAEHARAAAEGARMGLTDALAYAGLPAPSRRRGSGA